LPTPPIRPEIEGVSCCLDLQHCAACVLAPYTVNDPRLSRDFRRSIQISTEEQIKLRIPEAALVSPPGIEEPEDLARQTEQTVTTSKRKRGNSSARQTAVTKKRGKR
jgi:hypothetical protein